MGKKGQGLIEYSVLMIIIIAALLVTSNYVKRGIQGRWKSTVDEFGDQYDPRTINGKMTYQTNLTSNSVVSLNSDSLGIWTQREDRTVSTESTTGNTTVN